MDHSKNPLAPPVRAGLYARVSSERQAQAGTIASQIQAIQERLGRDGLQVEAEMRFIDDGLSGATLLRPALERLRDAAAAGVLDRLYVLCPDRLARSYAHQMLLVEELTRAGVELVFLNRPLGQSPEDNMLLQVQGVIAEYERAKIAERCRRGKLHAARQGRVAVLGNAPYGYRYVPGGLAQNQPQAQYNIHLEEATVVVQIFEWVGLERLSLYQVACRLRERGIPSPRGRAAWDRTTLRTILRNPAYKGQAAYGKKRIGAPRPRLRPVRNHTGRTLIDKACYAVPPEEWISIPVPPLVDPELFEAVGQQLEENRRRARQSPSGARWLLQGLLVCQCCGYAYCGVQKRPCPPGRHAPEFRYHYYCCLGGDADRYGGQRVCVNRVVRQEELDQAVWDDVRSILADPARIEQELTRRLEPAGESVSQERQRRLKAQIDKQRRGIGRLIDAYSDGFLDKQEFEPRMASARQSLARMQEQLQTHLDQEAQAAQLRLVSDNLQIFARQVHSGLDQADWLTRRQIIRTLVRRIDVGTEEIKVVYRVDLNPSERRSVRPLGQDCGRRPLE